jgi:hypothetical protein
MVSMADQTFIQDSRNVRAARAMAGFDDLPRDLRLFLHEHLIYGPQLDMIAAELRAGRRVTLSMAGKRIVLEPRW